MNTHTRRVVALTAAGILVAGALTGGGWWLGQRAERQPAASGVTAAPPATAPSATTSPRATTGSPATSAKPTPTTPPRAASWQRLPAAPLPGGSSGYAGVWTGRELLVYTPYPARGAGAAYNPTTRTWRKLPPAPGPVESIEGGYHAVWTGTELLGWGMGLDAAYNPATNTWRRLEGSVSAPSVMVWTGRQVLAWGGGCCDSYSDEGAAYTLATDSWQQLPRGPLVGRRTSGVWTGREMIVAGGAGRGPDPKVATETVLADAAAYNPATRSWRRLAPMPEPRAGATATWTGTEVLMVGGYGPTGSMRQLYTDGVAYNPSTNRWRHLPAMPTGRVNHTAVWTGGQLLVWGGRSFRGGSWTTPPSGVVYDLASGRWSAMPVSPLRGRTGHVAAWTGTQMLIWGGNSVTGPDTSFTDGAAYTLARL